MIIFRLKHIFYFFLFLLFFLSCVFRHSTWSPGSIGIHPDSIPGKEDFPHAGAIILLDEATVDIFTGKQVASSQIKRRFVVKILNEKGLKYANLTIPYSHHHTQILNLKAWTVLPDGSRIPLQKKHIFDVNLYPSFILYADIRAKRLTLPAVEPGCIVEYSWEEITKAFTYWTSFYFQHDEPTLLSRYIVRSPAEWDIHWKTYGIHLEPKTEQYPNGFKMTRIWEARNIPAFITETGKPPGGKDIPHIMFSPVGISDWNQISQWYQRLAEDRMKPTREIRQKVNQLISPSDSEKDKMRKIFEWVRNYIRYVAIEIGIGGFQPHYASEVFKNRFGDCKDMATLLVAMGQAAGIDVDPVLVSTWSKGTLDTSLVSHAHFNHAIAVATFKDSSKIWMDATDKDCEFGDVPWYDCNRLVLCVDDGGKAIIESTPAWTTNRNAAFSDWNIQILPDGSAKGHVSFSFTGAQANIIRKQLKYLHPSPPERWMGINILKKIPGTHCHDVQVENEKKYDLPIELKTGFETEHFLDFAGNSSVLSLENLTGFEFYTYFPEEIRTFDIEIGYPFKDIDLIHLNLPTTMEWPRPTVSDSIITDFGSYYFQITREDDVNILIHRELSVDSVHISKAHFKQFKLFLNSVAEKDRLWLNVPVTTQ